MKTREFYFDLPIEKIAQAPSAERERSRLFVLNRESSSMEHRFFRDLPDLLPYPSILVLNTSRVRKARIFARTESGGSIECIFLQPLDLFRWQIAVNRAKKIKPGMALSFPGDLSGVVESSEGNIKVIRFQKALEEPYFETHGHVPLPPYIKRDDIPEDELRYQTVYADATGSVAAPTAGLHFSEELLAGVKDRGITVCMLTLHVGLGTFLPIRTENVEEHHMHEERYEIPENTARIISRGKADGIPVVAVGTTCVRALESGWNGKRLEPGWSSTNLFIYPGYSFQVVDQIITNFHTPESSLLVLVSAFAGQNRIRKAYAEAIREGYRFFSYGDAMYIR